MSRLKLVALGWRKRSGEAEEAETQLSWKDLGLVAWADSVSFPRVASFGAAF